MDDKLFIRIPIVYPTNSKFKQILLDNGLGYYEENREEGDKYQDRITLLINPDEWPRGGIDG